MLPTITHLLPNQCITSDASGTWGCAAFCDTCWFAFPWEGTWEDVHITMKELLPIELARAIWGKYWKGQRLVCHCGNAAVVAIINSGSSKKTMAMYLMRSLFSVSAHYKSAVSARFVPHSSNQLADALSRNNADHFLSLHLQASHSNPTGTPPNAATQSAEWTSKSWRTIVQFFYVKGLAPSTLRSYEYGKDRYTNFCRQASITPLPVSESKLCISRSQTRPETSNDKMLLVSYPAPINLQWAQ